MMRTTEQQWRARVDEQERSGLTVREFARQRGLNGNTLARWRSKLRRSRAQETTLVPVEVVDGDPVGGPARLELVHRSGVALSLPPTNRTACGFRSCRNAILFHLEDLRHTPASLLATHRNA